MPTMRSRAKSSATPTCAAAELTIMRAQELFDASTFRGGLIPNTPTHTLEAHTLQHCVLTSWPGPYLTKPLLGLAAGLVALQNLRKNRGHVRLLVSGVAAAAAVEDGGVQTQLALRSRRVRINHQRLIDWNQSITALAISVEAGCADAMSMGRFEQDVKAGC